MPDACLRGDGRRFAPAFFHKDPVMRLPSLPPGLRDRLRLPRSRVLRIALIVVALGIPTMWLSARPPEAGNAALVAPVKHGRFTATITTSGELRAKQFVQITAPP